MQLHHAGERLQLVSIRKVVSSRPHDFRNGKIGRAPQAYRLGQEGPGRTSWGRGKRLYGAFVDAPREGSPGYDPTRVHTLYTMRQLE